jgi:hypothetical protein
VYFLAVPLAVGNWAEEEAAEEVVVEVEVAVISCCPSMRVVHLVRRLRSTSTASGAFGRQPLLTVPAPTPPQALPKRTTETPAGMLACTIVAYLGRSNCQLLLLLLLPLLLLKV